MADQRQTQGTSATRAVQKSPGQIAYEQELQVRPHYDDGTPRKRWGALDEVAQWSWNRNPSPRWSN